MLPTDCTITKPQVYFLSSIVQSNRQVNQFFQDTKSLHFSFSFSLKMGCRTHSTVFPFQFSGCILDCRKSKISIMEDLRKILFHSSSSEKSSFSSLKESQDLSVMPYSQTPILKSHICLSNLRKTFLQILISRLPRYRCKIEI